MTISGVTNRMGQLCLFFIGLECFFFWWYMQALTLQAARLLFMTTGISIAVGITVALFLVVELAWNKKSAGWRNVAFGCMGLAYAAYAMGEVIWPTVVRASPPAGFTQAAGAFAVLAVIALYKLDREHAAAPAPQATISKHPWTLKRIAFTVMVLNIAPMALVLFALLLGGLEGFWQKYGLGVTWIALVSGTLAVIFTGVIRATSWPDRADNFWNGIGVLGLCLASIAAWALF